MQCTYPCETQKSSPGWRASSGAACQAKHRCSRPNLQGQHVARRQARRLAARWLPRCEWRGQPGPGDGARLACRSDGCCEFQRRAAARASRDADRARALCGQRQLSAASAAGGRRHKQGRSRGRGARTPRGRHRDGRDAAARRALGGPWQGGQGRAGRPRAGARERRRPPQVLHAREAARGAGGSAGQGAAGAAGALRRRAGGGEEGLPRVRRRSVRVPFLLRALPLRQNRRRGRGEGRCAARDARARGVRGVVRGKLQGLPGGEAAVEPAALAGCQPRDAGGLEAAPYGTARHPRRARLSQGYHRVPGALSRVRHRAHLLRQRPRRLGASVNPAEP